jgi:hypothetical protein
VLTYPTGGVPITGATHLGVTEQVRACAGLECPTQLDDLTIISNSTGLKAEWDKATNKIKFYAEQAVALNAPLLEHTNATFAPNPCTLRVIAHGY